LFHFRCPDMALLLLLALFGFACGQLDVTIHSEVTSIDATVDAFPVTVTITNKHPVPVTACVWETPLDDASDVFRGDMFYIIHAQGEKATYAGILARRRPVLSDFVTLLPGQSINSSLDLFKGYWFPRKGGYLVSLVNTIRVHLGADLDLESVVKSGLDEFDFETVVSNSITADITKLSPYPFPTFNSTGLLGGPSPKTNCDSTRASQIRTSGANAITATNQGANYLKAATCSTGLSYYIEWFGACDATRYNKVKNDLAAISSGLSANYPVDCAGSSCSANTYAYVFPADTTHTVYVCAVFWKVSSNNCVMDSQPGTIIHEMSHFNNVAKTNDVTYGITNCRNLAKSNPAQAVTNADNFCFYTDSCPR